MKIAIGFKEIQGPWGGGNQFATALSKFLVSMGVSVYRDLQENDLDIILLTEPRKNLASCAFNHEDIYEYLQKTKKDVIVIHRINECDERKGTNDTNQIIISANEIASHTIYVATWLRDLYLEQGIKDKPYSVILNGSDRTIFNPSNSSHWNNKSRLKVVTHHWGASELKGFDIYRQLDNLLSNPAYKNLFSFTYIGNLPQNFKFKNAKYIRPLHGIKLAKEIKKHHIYLTASRNEPGGNHQNEGGNSGLPILYINSGCMPEYCEGFGIEFDENNFLERLEEIKTDYTRLKNKSHNYPHTSEKTGKEYLGLFKCLKMNRLKEIKPESLPHSSLPNYLKENLDVYLLSLRNINEPSRYLPHKNHEQKASINLGFQCFGIKIMQTLGTWKDFPHKDKAIASILSYQTTSLLNISPLLRNSFFDKELIKNFTEESRLINRLCTTFKNYPTSQLEKIVYAESKQAMATLIGIGHKKFPLYSGGAQSEKSILNFFNSLDWTTPWSAGGQFSAQMLFISQSKNFIKLRPRIEFLLDRLVDKNSGAYFLGDQSPNYDQLINGSMKIISGMDWCNLKIHYPEKLIDIALMKNPSAEGCHIVDTVYVIYMCLKQTNHKRERCQKYVKNLIPMILAHFHPEEGGFSYSINKAQTHYYASKISNGENIADIHGTVLLTWAFSMIFEILEIETNGWEIFKP